MVKLAELQQSFAKIALSDDIEIAVKEQQLPINSTPLSYIAHLQIYRNGVQAGLKDVLAEKFPLTQKLLGANFFHNLSLLYVRRAPPLAPSLGNYGKGFYDFLMAIPPLQKLPHALELLRLEIMMQACIQSTRSYTPVSGNKVPSQLDPACKILESPFDLKTLVQNLLANAPISKEELHQKTLFFIYRDHYKSYFMAVPEALQHPLHALFNAPNNKTPPCPELMAFLSDRGALISPLPEK